VLAPAGALGPSHPYATATALATRTFAWGRVHANAQGTLGPDVGPWPRRPWGPAPPARAPSS
jgi:hypothetical protein